MLYFILGIMVTFMFLGYMEYRKKTSTHHVSKSRRNVSIDLDWKALRLLHRDMNIVCYDHLSQEPSGGLHEKLFRTFNKHLAIEEARFDRASKVTGDRLDKSMEPYAQLAIYVTRLTNLLFILHYQLSESEIDEIEARLAEVGELGRRDFMIEADKKDKSEASA